MPLASGDTVFGLSMRSGHFIFHFISPAYEAAGAD
jgi:hypothetical protein